LPDPGTRRRNSSKKFNSNVRCVIDFGEFQPRPRGAPVNLSVHAVNRSDSKWRKSAWLERVFKALRAPARWHASCITSVHIGNAAANSKEGTTMKQLTTKLMIAAAALMMTAGAASAQAMKVEIPFEFRAGNHVMEPGTYRVDNVSPRINLPIFRLLNMHSGGSIALLPQAPVDPQKGWAEGNAKLVFACTSGSCALAEVWDGSGSYAYTFHGPNLGKDVTASLREIPMQRGKGE
jgi:hypothetical protein